MPARTRATPSSYPPVTQQSKAARRAFTPDAVPLNTLTPTRDAQVAGEQPGCLHAGMDLYKWAYKLDPFVPSELITLGAPVPWNGGQPPSVPTVLARGDVEALAHVLADLLGAAVAAGVEVHRAERMPSSGTRT